MEKRFDWGAAGVFVLCFAVFYFLQTTTKNIIGVDGYFHAKYASMILKEGIMREFWWWKYGMYADTHFLFHVILIPFSYSIKLTKLFTVFLGSAALTSMYWFLKKYKAEFSAFWVLLIFAFGTNAVYRYSLPRAYILGIILFLSGFYFVIEKKYKYLGILAFVFVWSYTAFMFFAGILILFFIYEWFVFGIKDIKLLKYGLGGTILGLIINPFFPHNIKTMFLQVVDMMDPPTGIQMISADAQPFSSFSVMFSLLWFMIILFVLSLIIFFKNKKYTDKTSSLIGISAVSTFILLTRQIRFTEYWIPFTIIFAGLMFSDYFKKMYNKTVEIVEGKKIVFTRKKIAAVLIVFLVIFMFAGIKSTEAKIKYTESIYKPDKNLPCGRWLERNTEKGSLVFHYWHEFPFAWYYNDNNKYFFGLGPGAMHRVYPELYKKYEMMGLIQTNKTAEWLKEDFDADYIFLGTVTNKFEPYYSLFKSFEKVFNTEYCTVYKIKK